MRFLKEVGSSGSAPQIETISRRFRRLACSSYRLLPTPSLPGRSLIGLLPYIRMAAHTHRPDRRRGRIGAHQQMLSPSFASDGGEEPHRPKPSASQSKFTSTGGAFINTLMKARRGAVHRTAQRSPSAAPRAPYKTASRPRRGPKPIPVGNCRVSFRTIAPDVVDRNEQPLRGNGGP